MPYSAKDARSHSLVLQIYHNIDVCYHYVPEISAMFMCLNTAVCMIIITVDILYNTCICECTLVLKNKYSKFWLCTTEHTGARHLMVAYIILAPPVDKAVSIIKLWRESHCAKGMHAFIDYHRSCMLPSNVENL